MKRVLLTGANGNLGSALRRAEPAIEWRSVTRLNWQNVDQLLPGTEAILHAASDLHRPVSESPQALLEANVMTTAQLVEKAKAFNIPRFIFISSCAVYGNSQVTTEATTPIAPISVNGICKSLCEKVVAEFCQAHNIKFEIYRLFNSFGGNDRFSILSHLRKSIETGKPFMINNNGLSQRDFIHIDDIARILVTLLKTPPSQTCLNIGSGKTARIRDIVNLAVKRYPNLKLAFAERHETEYSRADIARLTATIGPFKFYDIMDFIASEWVA